MRKASSPSRCFARRRIQILMCALVAERLASPLGAGIGLMANRGMVRHIVLPVAGHGSGSLGDPSRSFSPV
jgi:hypothetical protein